ncbi:Predicted PurR-regulated permease PerM [Amphibacillus marinus]|uniref:Predicted PurR-regulated permease PerM n=2 Tax=Amphibacillus marinus TaxID=872970 RepID=A0A1H8I398_9BACI|nr:Predicted PurR-regulated permease PerM [Amphibacillus marinus]
MLVISTVSYTLATLAEANEQVTQDISDFARGSYDILIRPPDARTDLESNLNIIEENYLGLGAGGISINQWNSIKENPNVEIAAPVASIGMFTARERTFMVWKEPQESLYYEVDYMTNDGVHTYKDLNRKYMYDFGDGLIYPSSAEVTYDYVGYDIASFSFPISYHQVVAIDPEQEGKLTNFDFTPLTEVVSDQMEYENGQYSIPIMSLENVTIPVTVQLLIDRLEAVSDNELEAWNSQFIEGNPFLTYEKDFEEYKRIIETNIAPKREMNEVIYELEPDETQSPFKQTLLVVDEQTNNLESNTDPYSVGGAFYYHSQRIGYRLEPVKYEITEDDTLAVRQTGSDDIYGAPTYRNFTEVIFYELLEEADIPVNNEDYLGFIENGTFSIEENAETLASAPLGIYGRELPHLAYNSNEKLYPSAVPGSFINTPAHGLISIENAEKAKGEAPIDAIRVKVSGITGYDKVAAERIRSLAEAWEAEGFTVDIVAGASLQDLEVDVEGIGIVIQSFTTLGAADTVLSSWNVLQMALTVLYALVALTFVIFTFFNMLVDRQKAEALLAKLGWSNKLIRSLRYKEWSTILGVPAIVVILGFLIYGLGYSVWLPFYISIVISFGCVILYVFLDLTKLNQFNYRIMNKPLKKVVLQNVWFYKFSILAAGVQSLLITILTCFLPFFLIENVTSTTQTRIGAYVHGEIEGIFILVIVLLYILSLVTVYQSIRRLMERRQAEIKLFEYLGWAKKAIRRYFLAEISLWAGICSVIGWGISLGLISLLINLTSTIILLGAVGLIFILMLTLGISAQALRKYSRE